MRLVLEKLLILAMCWKEFRFLTVVICELDCACSTKKSPKGKAPGKAGSRFWKSVGLGFKTPREAIEGRLDSEVMLEIHSNYYRCNR